MVLLTKVSRFWLFCWSSEFRGVLVIFFYVSKKCVIFSYFHQTVIYFYTILFVHLCIHRFIYVLFSLFDWFNSFFFWVIFRVDQQIFRTFFFWVEAGWSEPKKAQHSDPARVVLFPCRSTMAGRSTMANLFHGGDHNHLLNGMIPYKILEKPQCILGGYYIIQGLVSVVIGSLPIYTYVYVYNVHIHIYNIYIYSPWNAAKFGRGPTTQPDPWTTTITEGF